MTAKENPEENTVEFFQQYGYYRCREKQLRQIAGGKVNSLAMEVANQIKHLKSQIEELKDLSK